MSEEQSGFARGAAETRAATGMTGSVDAATRPDVYSDHPTTARWTHVALPCADIDASIDFYTTFTPMELLDKRTDALGHGAWLGHSDAAERPFILVLIEFFASSGQEGLGLLKPFAHLGIELPTLEAVDEIAARGEAAGCLNMAPTEMPPPVGYICALNDPDGNVIEYSYDQGVYSTAKTVWGTGD